MSDTELKEQIQQKTQELNELLIKARATGIDVRKKFYWETFGTDGEMGDWNVEILEVELYKPI